jgi:cell division protein FtsN
MKEHTGWKSWEAQEPPPGFVDRVLGATVQTRSEEQNKTSSPRTLTIQETMLLAAAAVMVSFAAVAALVQSVGWQKPAPAQSSPPEKESDRESPDDTALLAVPPVSATEERVKRPSTVSDRQRHEDVRAQLRAAFEARGVPYDPHTGLPIAQRAQGPSGNLSPEYIQARVRGDFYPLARSCYEAALERVPNLRRRLVMKFSIVGDAKIGGIVEQAEVEVEKWAGDSSVESAAPSDSNDREFATCMRESMLSMVFEPPDNGGWVTVVYPILFSPDDEAPGPDR